MTDTPANPLTLDRLPMGMACSIVAIDWDSLAPRDANRLRNFGFDDGVTVTALHRGPFGADPLAVRVGRMTVAIGRHHAAALTVRPLAKEATAAA